MLSVINHVDTLGQDSSTEKCINLSELMFLTDKNSLQIKLSLISNKLNHAQPGFTSYQLYSLLYSASPNEKHFKSEFVEWESLQTGRVSVHYPER